MPGTAVPGTEVAQGTAQGAGLGNLTEGNLGTAQGAVFGIV